MPKKGFDKIIVPLTLKLYALAGSFFLFLVMTGNSQLMCHFNVILTLTI